MKKYFSLVLVLFFAFVTAIKAQIYVSPNGDDTNPGTINKPFKTVQKAMSVAGADSLIYLREGIYNFSSTLKPPVDGQKDKYIKLWAYPGEKAILDFSGQSYSSKSRGLYLSKDYWYIKGLTVRNAGDNGIFISGSHNIVEDCTIYNNKDTGLQISDGGSYNYVHDCDSFANYDPATHGENADGFAPKLSVGPGNVFRGCRSFYNADDGWDCYEAKYTMVFDSCWSFANGYNRWNDSNYQGDGNGFKVGGNYVPASHRLTNCVAFDNPSKGFDQNHNTSGVTIMNCTAYNNGRNYYFGEIPKTGRDTLVNNLSYGASVSIEDSAFVETNSWQGFTVSNSDFVSIDTSLASSARLSDGSIANNNFLRLTKTSSLVDAGTDVGISFNGSAPDIGAFESSYIMNSVTIKQQLSMSYKLEQNYPNPFNPSTVISYYVPKISRVNLSIYNILGIRVAQIVNGIQGKGYHEINFDASKLSSGVYFYKLQSSGFVLSKKMILQK